MILGACLALLPIATRTPFASPSPPVTEADFLPIDEKQAELGRLLFYDPLLSGNRNISCGTCHHHDHHGGDGLSLGVGEGGEGVGPERTPGSGADKVRKRVPRNAPSLFNLGATEIDVLFHDGRLSVSELYGNGFNSPAEEYLPQGLSSIVAAQALFPLTSETEMAGNPGENDIAGATKDRVDMAWPIIAERVRHTPGYGPLFVEAFADINQAEEISIHHIGNAIGAFVTSEWRSFDSRYDRHLAGEAVLSAQELRGMDLFFGAAGCSSCHSGKFLTDQDFHALGVPQFGPGRTRTFDPYTRDVGRMGETDRLEDAYRFRTPALRNVALTGPYGHNGAYQTLEGIVRHHLDARASFAGWDRSQTVMPEADWLEPTDFVVLSDRREVERMNAAIEIDPIDLSDEEVSDIVSFLKTLTGGNSVKGRLGKPEAVPSGLPVD